MENKKITKSIYQKLIAVRKCIPYIQKENQGKGMQYKFVSSSQALSEIRPLLDREGLLLIPNLTDFNIENSIVESTDYKGNKKIRTDYVAKINIEYTWVNVEDDEKIIIKWASAGTHTEPEKALGKAYTYGEKYFLLKFFNIATDEDDPDFYQNKIDVKQQKLQQKQQIIPPEKKEKLAALSSQLKMTDQDKIDLMIRCNNNYDSALIELETKIDVKMASEKETSKKKVNIDTKKEPLFNPAELTGKEKDFDMLAIAPKYLPDELKDQGYITGKWLATSKSLIEMTIDNQKKA